MALINIVSLLCAIVQFAHAADGAEGQGMLPVQPSFADDIREGLLEYKRDKRRKALNTTSETAERRRYLSNDEEDPGPTTDSKNYVDEDCVTLLQKYTNNFMSNGDTIVQMYRNSGKDYNDYGRMDDCEAHPEFDYLLGSVTTERIFPIPISMGICLPTVCNEANLNELKPYIMKALNNQLPYIFEEDSGFNMTGIELVGDDIHFAQSMELNRRVTTFTMQNLYMILFMILLVLLSIVASIISHQKFKERKRRAQERRKAKLSGQSEPAAMKKFSSGADQEQPAASQASRILQKFKPSTKSMALFDRFLRSFSINRNLKRLFSKNRYDPDEKEFEIFNALKVYGICIVVLGNTYYFILSGPIQNLEVISDWFKSKSFLIILGADLQCDMFYWITGFVGSFQLLKRIHHNGEVWPAHPAKIFFERYLRLIPLYVFMIFFLWKFISLFGGAGPKFYQFETSHGCADSWIWHFLMLNNIAPWESPDYCIEETWYIANDFWFMIAGLHLLEKFRTNRNMFFGLSIMLSVFCLVIQTISIFQNSFSASYLTYNDEYWTIYFKKPFCHFHSYNMGVLLGCSYFKYKYQEYKKGSRIHSMLENMKQQNMTGGLCVVLGILIQFIILIINSAVNNHPDIGVVGSMFYLLLSRPIYIVGFSLMVMPLVLQNKVCKPIINILAHKQWIPYARLTYGVFLCNTIFMQYRIFNLQHGDWAQRFVIDMYFCAFFAISFLFSFATYIFVEAPLANVVNEFFRSKSSAEVLQKSSIFFRSQSAKAHLRDKSKKARGLRRSEAGGASKATDINSSVSESLISSDSLEESSDHLSDSTQSK